MPTTLRKTAATALLMGALTASAAPEPADEPNLKPVLLQDADEVREYVADFPFDRYMRVKYPNMGCRLSADPTSFMPCLFDWWMEPIVGSFWIERQRPRGWIKELMIRGDIWEKHFVRAMKTYIKPGSRVIDIGAYIGIHSMLMGRRAGEAGKVYAFEPQRKVYRELVQNIALNGMEDVVIPLRFALGGKAGLVEMDKPIVKGSAGLGLAGSPSLLVESAVKVGAGGDKAEMRPLDDFGFTNVSLIKIDVEGLEDPVLEGAARTIAENRPVVILEIMGGVAVYPGSSPDTMVPEASPEQLESIHATWRLLERHGYEVRPIVEHDYIALPLERADDASWPIRDVQAERLAND